MDKLTFRIGYSVKVAGYQRSNGATIVDAVDVNEATNKVRSSLKLDAGVDVRWTTVSVRCTGHARGKVAGHGTRPCGRWVSDGTTRCCAHTVKPAAAFMDEPAVYVPLAPRERSTASAAATRISTLARKLAATIVTTPDREADEVVTPLAGAVLARRVAQRTATPLNAKLTVWMPGGDCHRAPALSRPCSCGCSQRGEDQTVVGHLTGGDGVSRGICLVIYDEAQYQMLAAVLRRAGVQAEA